MRPSVPLGEWPSSLSWGDPDHGQTHYFGDGGHNGNVLSDDADTVDSFNFPSVLTPDIATKKTLNFESVPW